MRRPFLLLALLCVSSPAVGQVGGHYWMRNSATGSGSGRAAGGAYVVDGIAGMAEAGAHNAGPYVLYGGFFGPALRSLVAVEDPVPRAVVLRAPTPSPFRDRAAIAFELPEPRRVSLVVYSVGGRRVRGLMDEELGAGRHTTYWNAVDDDGRPVPPGMYFVSFTAGGYSAVQRIVHLD